MSVSSTTSGFIIFLFSIVPHTNATECNSIPAKPCVVGTYNWQLRVPGQIFGAGYNRQWDKIFRGAGILYENVFEEKLSRWLVRCVDHISHLWSHYYIIWWELHMRICRVCHSYPNKKKRKVALFRAGWGMVMSLSELGWRNWHVDMLAFTAAWSVESVPEEGRGGQCLPAACQEPQAACGQSYRRQLSQPGRRCFC